MMWFLGFLIKSGQLDNFKELVEELVRSTQNEPDTLPYEWFISEDNRICRVYERYPDSAATMARLGNLTKS